MTDLEIKKALASALVDAWGKGITTRQMIIGISRDLDVDAGVVYTMLGQVSGKSWVADVMVKNYIKTNFPQLSDALWEARSTAGILNAARRAVGIKAKPNTVARLGVGTRALDKSHDWSTVK